MIAITGGAGFIGSALVWHLNQHGRTDLLVVDELGRDQKFQNLSPLSFADYMEKDEFRKRLERSLPVPPLEAIVHLGACSATTEADASYLMRNNFGYTRALAEWALQRDTRFVYASSAATYGDGSTGYDDAAEKLRSLRPLNKYAFSKHAFDQWALERGALKQIAGLKYFNVYGPNEYHKGEMRSVALKAFEQIRERGGVRLFKSHRRDYRDGEQQRDFIYVKDAVAVTAWFLEAPAANGIFNVGSGRARTWNDLARAVLAAAGTPEKIEYIDMPEAIRGAYQYSTCAQVDRLRAAGCPVHARKLEDGIADYVCKYLLTGCAHLQLGDGP